MEIRRPLAALVTAVALVGGGALTACSSPTDAKTGTPADTATKSNSSGNNPGGNSQGNLPNNSNKTTGASSSQP
jgi:hypothetical protein